MFEFSSIEQYHAQLQERKTTCVQAVEHYLLRIKAKAHLNAFNEVYADAALQKAKTLDQERNAGHATGKLHGVVVSLKDVICYKDHPVSGSSKILKGFHSIYSATAVERLLAEEAIIIGHCNCDEFGMGSTNEYSANGNVLNSHEESRVPGGSSGGSAVSVQAGLCMIALGADTGGSVRQPADFCGVIGFKPSYGRISRYGLLAYASSFDQIGIIGNTIADIALLLKVMEGVDEYDSTLSGKNVFQLPDLSASAKKYRFAYFPETLEYKGIDPEIAHSIKELMQELKAAGHEITPVRFGLLDYIVPAYYILTTAEASSNLSRYDGVKFGFRDPGVHSDISDLYKSTRTNGFGKEVKRRIMLGTFVLSVGYYDAYFTQAQKVRRLLKEQTEAIFSDYDCLIMPTSPSIAFKLGEKNMDPIAMYMSDIYTVFANLVGIPAIALPLFKHSTGMPFGVQALGARFKEKELLETSQVLIKSGPAK